MANQPQDQQPPRRPGSPPRAKKDERDANEQSGSTGRNPGTGDEKQDGKDTGQDDYGMTGGADRDPPQPGHESGSSGTSEYGRSDYGEPGEHEAEPSKETSMPGKKPQAPQRRERER
jgi:hypothetical protein